MQFQSSPVPEDGCNNHRVAHKPDTERVSILTRPGGRVQLHPGSCPKILPAFQSSPVPEDGCNTRYYLCGATSDYVSILTRPGGRVQQPTYINIRFDTNQFQSSPVPEDGCNVADGLPVILLGSFNPHPSRRTGATT